MLCVSHSDYPPLINRSAGPLISLCCICKSWQKVASGLPMLWTAASVYTNTINRKWQRKLPQLLDRWFSRSNPLPLYFKFTPEIYRHDKVMKVFTSCVTPFAHRFRHLDIDLLNFVCSSSWSTLQFPQLESAIIRGNIDVYDNLESPLFPLCTPPSTASHGQPFIHRRHPSPAHSSLESVDPSHPRRSP